MVNTPKAKEKIKTQAQYDTLDLNKGLTEYSYARALIAAHPELNQFFTELGHIVTTTGKPPTQQEFDKATHKYKFFQDLSANQTAAELAKAQDPKGYAASIAQHASDIRSTAEQQGVPLDDNQVNEIASLTRYNGWNSNQINEKLFTYMKGASAKNLNGIAGDAQNELTQWASKNGISLSPEAADKMIANITFNKQSLDDVKNDLRKTYITGAYPAYGDRFAQGLDPSTVFDPIVGSVQNLLEDKSIDLHDPLIKRITQAVDSDGKPRVVPLYEVEQMTRQDPRWGKTDNAYATTANSLKGLLSTFGIGV